VPPVVIDNPILNSPFTEPARHFRFDDDGITNEIAEGRHPRVSRQLRTHSNTLLGRP
jgi:hypothetical protein